MPVLVNGFFISDSSDYLKWNRDFIKYLFLAIERKFSVIRQNLF